MTALLARQRPLVAVIFRVPLFVEAVAAAFEGLADVQALRSGDVELAGLLAALRPNAVIYEGSQEPLFQLGVPLAHVDLEGEAVRLQVDDMWVRHEIELSGEAIRNLVLSAMFAGMEV